MSTFKTESLSPRILYRLLTSSIVPRPIAWVSTVSGNGTMNTAPFSFFTGVSVVPPILMFAVERRHGKKKDTLVNIEETGEFVVNVVTEYNARQMNLSSQDFEIDVDEFEMSDLTPVPGTLVRVPRIAQSPVHLECKLERIIEIGSSPHALVFGEVVCFHVSDDVMNGERVDFSEFVPVGRLGGPFYVKSSDKFEMSRLDWRKTEF